MQQSKQIEKTIRQREAQDNDEAFQMQAMRKQDKLLRERNWQQEREAKQRYGM